MSDDFEDLLKRWLRDRAGNDRSALQALAGNVATLPPRRRQPGRLLPLVASVAVVVGVLAVVSPRFGSIGNDASPTPSPTMRSPGIVLPGGPEAFAGDPRLATCTVGAMSDMQYAFVMTRGRDYHRYFPAMLLSPELDIDTPVFVIVYREGFEPVFGGALGAVRPTPRPGHRTVCAVVEGERIVYGDVDITGLTVDVVPSSPGPSESSLAPSQPPPTITPEPAPAWAGDASAALGCARAPSTFGSEGPPGGAVEGFTSDEAVGNYLRDIGNLFQPFPTTGVVQLELTSDWALYGYSVEGQRKAVIVLHRRSQGANPWFVSAVATCDPSEFAPDVRLGVDIKIWTTIDGIRVPTTQVLEIADCYDGTQVTVGGHLFVWDPNNGLYGAYDPAQLESTFASDIALPLDAVDTGFRQVDRGLFLAPDGTAAYISKVGVQRWPHVKDDEVFRIDCN